MAPITIHRLGSAEPVKLAARELKRCLAQVSGQPVVVTAARRYAPLMPGLWLGTFADLHLTAAADSDSGRDDEVAIQVGASGGYVAGSNPRSVLLAVYRYLTELGCRWVRPGRTGEYLPYVPFGGDVCLRERASYRHRGVCIEGAVSWEHVRDMVEWLPKLGLNAYFIQFRQAQTFFQRWYEHEHNPLLPAADFGPEQAGGLTARLRDEIKRRGLDLHAVGHGWTCEPFGIPGPGWYPHVGPVPPAAIPHLAQVNGKRELWGGVALNTNLCYGNPDTRSLVAEAVVHYAAEHTSADLIHVWLADGANNHCECDLCRAHRPADLYVRLLNEVDARLTQAGLGARIVFLAYVDLLWPPQRERLANAGRFVLMFAPITRSYSVPFTAAGGGLARLPAYRRNRLSFPTDPAANISFLRAWQEQFSGESFDFDYHLMWDHYRDPGQLQSAAVLHADIQGLEGLGLDGLISCQVQRVAFPTGLGMTVLGRTLWCRQADLNAIVADHFRSCYGPGGDFVRDWLEALSQLIEPRALREELDSAQLAACVEGWRAIDAQVAQAEPHIAAGMRTGPPCHRHSWELLQYFGAMCRLLGAALVARHTADAPVARAAALALVHWARAHERRLHHVFDVFEFVQVVGGYLRLTPQEMRQ